MRYSRENFRFKIHVNQYFLLVCSLFWIRFMISISISDKLILFVYTLECGKTFNFLYRREKNVYLTRKTLGIKLSSLYFRYED